MSLKLKAASNVSLFGYLISTSNIFFQENKVYSTHLILQFFSIYVVTSIKFYNNVPVLAIVAEPKNKFIFIVFQRKFLKQFKNVFLNKSKKLVLKRSSFEKKSFIKAHCFIILTFEHIYWIWKKLFSQSVNFVFTKKTDLELFQWLSLKRKTKLV